jgi:hypothetical protein
LCWWRLPPLRLPAIPGLLAIVQAAEEQRRVRQILQRLGAAVQVGLEVLKGHPVGGHGIDGEHVLPHEPEVLARLDEMGALCADDRIFAVVPGVGGHG